MARRHGREESDLPYQHQLQSSVNDSRGRQLGSKRKGIDRPLELSHAIRADDGKGRELNLSQAWVFPRPFIFTRPACNRLQLSRYHSYGQWHVWAFRHVMTRGGRKGVTTPRMRRWWTCWADVQAISVIRSGSLSCSSTCTTMKRGVSNKGQIKMALVL